MSIVVTGAGLLTTLGVGSHPVYQRLLSGSAQSSGSVPDFEPKEYLGKKGLRHFDRTALLLASATKMALDESDLSAETYGHEDLGVVIGSTHGSIQAIAEFDQEAVREGPKYVNPQHFPNTVISAPAGRIAVLFQANGLNATIASGNTSALEAVDYAAGMLRLGNSRAIVCGAGLGASPEIEAGFRRAGMLAAADAPSIPFSPERDGLTLSEGAAAFTLETKENAAARGATPKAVVTGAGSSFSMDSTGPVHALETALRNAGLDADQISMVISCASGNRKGDQEEGQAIAVVLGSVPVTAPKALTGDCLEASGAIGVALAIEAMVEGQIPPVAGLQELDPALNELNVVRGEALQQPVEHVLVTARDPQGHCGALILSKPA